MSGHLFETKNIVAVQSYTCFRHPTIVLEFAMFLWKKAEKGKRPNAFLVRIRISATSLYFYGWPQGGRQGETNATITTNVTNTIAHTQKPNLSIPVAYPYRTYKSEAFKQQQ